MTGRARIIGINHVALDVGDVEEALGFYGRIFELTLRGRVPGMAFVDMGDQFLALAEHSETGDEGGGDRHFGLVVDDAARVRVALGEAGIAPLPGRGLRFRDPWGNQVEVVEYGEIQFLKATEVAEAMGIAALAKTPEAIEELREKGIEPPAAAG